LKGLGFIMFWKCWKGISFLLAFVLVIGLVIGCQIHIEEEEEENPGLPLHEYKIPAKDPGIELYLREKNLNNEKQYKGEEVVLFLEPFDIPTVEAFDIKGWSWMEHLAGQGFDTWALDFRGFGQSSRPEVKVTAADAVKDVEAAVDFIKKTKKVDKVNVIGWGWGAVVGARYAGTYPENVNKLLLYGPMHASQLPEMTQSMEASPGVMKEYPNYELRTYDFTRQHWAMMLRGRDLVNPGIMADVGRAYFMADVTSEEREPKTIRQNMGPMIDLYNSWSNKPVFDAGKITSPTLVVRGDEDIFADPDLINSLTGTKNKKEIVIKNSTHWLLYEKHRDELLTVILEFLIK
jgi:pimeloyl-ACP methyl ester carboxylesterase